MDDEEPDHPHQLLHRHVRVVEERAVLLQRELERVAAAGRDGVEAEPGHAVDVGRDLEPVPVRGEDLGQAVLDDDAHPVTFGALDGRAGHRPVEPPRIDIAAGEEGGPHRLGNEVEHLHAAVESERQRRHVGRLDANRHAAGRRRQRAPRGDWRRAGETRRVAWRRHLVAGVRIGGSGRCDLRVRGRHRGSTAGRRHEMTKEPTTGLSHERTPRQARAGPARGCGGRNSTAGAVEACVYRRRGVRWVGARIGACRAGGGSARRVVAGAGGSMVAGRTAGAMNGADRSGLLVSTSP